MTDLDTDMENSSDLIMAILYGLQLMLCALMLAQLRKRREQRRLRRLFFVLCALGALLRCLYFGIPDSVFSQGYRPANRKPEHFGSQSFLLNGLQFLIYSVPNCLYFLQYCLIICAYAGMISVLFSQRPTHQQGGGAGANGTLVVAPAAAKASGSADDDRMIPYAPASRFFRLTALSVLFLQLLLLGCIFLFDFFYVVAATCIFVSALACFSVVAYGFYAYSMVRKLRPVYKYVLNKAQWEAVARQHSYAAVAASPGGPMSFAGAPRNSRVLLRSREEHEGFTDRDGLDTSIDRSGRIPNRMRGGAAAQIERERDQEAGLDAYPPLHSLPSPILPANAGRGLGSRSTSQGTSPTAAAMGTSAAMAAATAGRYSPHHSLVPQSSALALLQMQQQQQQGASSSMTTNGLVSVSSGATVNATSSSSGSRSTTVSHSSGNAAGPRPSLTNAQPSTSDELSYEPHHEGDSESDEDDEEDGEEEESASSDDEGSAGAGYDEGDEPRPRQVIGVGVSTGSGSDEEEITLHALPRVAGKHMQDSSPLARPQPSPRGPGAAAIVPLFAPTPMVAGSPLSSSAAINISGANQNRKHIAQQQQMSRSQQAQQQPKLSYSPVRNNGRSHANGAIDQQPSTSVDHVISEADFYRHGSPLDSTPPTPQHPTISYTSAASRGGTTGSSNQSSTGGSGAVSPDYTALDASSTLVPTPRVVPLSAARGGVGGGGIAAGLKKPGPSHHSSGSGMPSPLRSSRSFVAVPAPALPLLSAPNVDAADSAEDQLAWYAYAQTRKIALLTLVVVLCSGARIASALIELHYTWLQMETSNMTSSDFPDYWFIYIDSYYFLFELLSSSVVTWLLMQSSATARSSINGGSNHAATDASAISAASAHPSAVYVPSMLDKRSQAFASGSAALMAAPGSSAPAPVSRYSAAAAASSSSALVLPSSSLGAPLPPGAALSAMHTRLLQQQPPMDDAAAAAAHRAGLKKMLKQAKRKK